MNNNLLAKNVLLKIISTMQAKNVSYDSYSMVLGIIEAMAGTLARDMFNEEVSSTSDGNHFFY